MFHFINYELDIFSFIAFRAFLRRLKKSLSCHLSCNRPQDVNQIRGAFIKSFMVLIIHTVGVKTRLEV